jgi:type IV pilus assembly protein PilY1
LFKADELGRARWPGNIKKLRLDSTGSILVDTSGSNAVATDGRIKYDALTYWTSAADLPPADTSENEVDGKDGRSVERGGAGQKIPGFIGNDPGALNSDAGARQLYYEPSSSGTLLSTKPLDADSTTATALQTLLGAADSTEALELLKYARGKDVTDDDGDNDKDEARNWVLGDSLHSRPLPINYGNANANNDPDIRILMGTNDGFMHMFKNTNPSTTNDQLGTEVWAFMPNSVMGIVKDLKDNHVIDHLYGVDGPPAAYVHDDANDGVISGANDKVWLYFGLRRGGKAYYALDISDPDAPKKLWTIQKTVSGDFDELGYTFSQPRVDNLNWGSGVKPVVMFAGGYDTNKDTRKTATAGEPNAALGTDDSEGNAIYIVDAETGALVWKAAYGASAGYDSGTKTYSHPGLVDSIPSTLTAVDTDADGLVDRMYVGDTGGAVWRVDTSGTSRSSWTVVKLADQRR